MGNRPSAPTPSAFRAPVRVAAAALAAVLSLAGAAAEGFELEGLDATRTRMSEHVGGGQWTLVQLWTTDCVPCEAQKPMLREFDEQSDRARVIGVALDGRAAIDEILQIVERHGASYETLVAFEDVFAEQYEGLTGRAFRATPTYLLYGPEGGFAGAHVGPISREALEQVVAGAD